MYINNQHSNAFLRRFNMTRRRTMRQREIDEMASIGNVTQGINADILTNMKASKKILNKVAEDRQNAATESKAYFKEVIEKSTEIKNNVSKGINVDVTV